MSAAKDSRKMRGRARMIRLSSEQEQQILQELTDPNLDWVEDLDATGQDIIIGRLGCSPEEAGDVLNRMRPRMEAVSESRGMPRADAPLKSRWKWAVKRGSK